MPHVSEEVIYLGESKIIDNNGTPYVRLDRKILTNYRGIVKVYYDFKRRQFIVPFTMPKVAEGTDVIELPAYIRQDHFVDFLALVKANGTRVLRKDAIYLKYRTMVKGKEELLKIELDTMFQYLITTRKIVVDPEGFMHYAESLPPPVPPEITKSLEEEADAVLDEYLPPNEEKK